MPFTCLKTTVFVASILLSACATQIASLTPTPQVPTRTIKNPHAFRGNYSETVYTVLAPGQYVPVGRSDQGTWYLGPPENVVRVHVDTAKNRADKKTFVVVHRGGVLVPENPDGIVQLFYIPSSERYSFVDLRGWNGEAITGSSNPTLSLVLNQVLSGPPAGAAATGVGVAVATAIIDFDRGGFKVWPGDPPQPNQLLRRWLFE